MPEGWAWCRLPSICKIPITDGTHQTPTYSDKENGIPFLSSKDVTFQKIDWSKIKYISKDLHEELQKRVKPQRNDILLAKNGTTGVAAIVETDDVFDIYVTLALLRPCKQLNPRFLLHMINSPFCKDQFNGHLTGIGVPNLHLNDICKTLIPVPPYSEQIQIVNEIEKIILLIDTLETDKEDLKSTIKQAKSKILDLAIHGKLVPQDSSDEPASVLLVKLRTEKEAKIKAGELKRDKNDSYIYRNTTDNCYYEKFADGTKNEIKVPFELPDSWAWTSLGTICDYGKSRNASVDELNDETWVLDLEDIEKDTGGILKFVTLGTRNSLSTKHVFKKGDILYSKLRPYLNKVVIAPKAGVCTSEILPLDFNGILINEYAQCLLMSSYFLATVNLVTYGVKMPRLGTDDAKKMLLPVPPLNEQLKIICSVKKLQKSLDEIALNLV